MTTSSLELLTKAGQQMYQLFTRRRDALFDLTDALLTTGHDGVVSTLLSPPAVGTTRHKMTLY